MPQTKEYTIYTFEELSDAAKEKARDWLRALQFNDSSDWEFVYEDAVTVGALIGIEIDRRTFKTMGGGTGSEPTIYFSGFSSQGDGACFEGTYSYRKGALKALKQEIGGESKGDKELIRIATELQELQRRNFYRLEARMKHSGHYNHSGCMSVDIDFPADRYISDDEQALTRLMRDFADWIYRQLEAEYDYRCSDEQIDDSMDANQYTFDINGNRED